MTDDFILYSFGIFTGIPANMLHKYIYFFAAKMQVFGVIGSNIHSINISINALEWPDFTNLTGKVSVSKISGMPYLVALFQVTENCTVKETMGI